MDLYNENRTLINSGPLARRQRSENWSGWTDLEVGLLDNYGMPSGLWIFMAILLIIAQF